MTILQKILPSLGLNEPQDGSRGILMMERDGVKTGARRSSRPFAQRQVLGKQNNAARLKMRRSRVDCGGRATDRRAQECRARETPLPEARQKLPSPQPLPCP